MKRTVLLTLALLPACAREEPHVPTPRPRPVRVMELREVDPTGSVQLTGAVTAWSESDVAFEVEGRVAYVVEGGTDLAGRWEEDGEVRVTGDVLARLDTQTYEIRLDHARAVLAAAQGELATAVVELERVLPATVAAAAANRDRALAEVERTRAAREKNAISELDLIRSEADWQQRKADYERAVASLEAQRVALDALRANVETARESMRAAEYDLERCTLYAPFEGEVSTVHIEAGGYARRAEPVAHIVMMDPMTIELAVSSARAAEVDLGQSVQVFLPGHDEVAFGTVYEKATVADAATRTFTVKVVIRNQRRYGALSSGNPALAQPRIADTMYANRLVPGDASSSLFVEERRAVQRDSSGRTFVWAASGHRMGDAQQLEGAIVTLNRVEVKLGPQRRNFQGRYLMRELSDPGGVEEGTLIALDVPEDVTDGQEVLLARDRWLLRPGMLVRVVLDLDPPEPGFYVPLSAMRPGEAGLGRIYLAEGGRVRPVEVRTVGTLREFARIEAVDGGALGAGAKVVVDHVHFLQAGEPVSVVRTLEFTP